jgi:hypothetical protein
MAGFLGLDELFEGRHFGAEGPTVRTRTLAYCTQCRRVALAALTP